MNDTSTSAQPDRRAAAWRFARSPFPLPPFHNAGEQVALFFVTTLAPAAATEETE